MHETIHEKLKTTVTTYQYNKNQNKNFTAATIELIKIINEQPQ